MVKDVTCFYGLNTVIVKHGLTQYYDIYITYVSITACTFPNITPAHDRQHIHKSITYNSYTCTELTHVTTV
jgi:hypothetical protein